MRSDRLNDLLRLEYPDIPDGWHWYRLEAGYEGNDSVPPDKIRITGAVAPPYLAGPRKGKPNFKLKDKSTVRVLWVEKRLYQSWQNSGSL